MGTAEQDLIQKMRTTKAKQDREYPNYGKYKFEILSIGCRRGFNGLSGFLELKVIESSPLPSFPENFPDTEAVKKTPHPVGKQVSYVEAHMDEGKKGEGATARFKGALIKVFGETDEAQADSILVAAVGAKQPAAFMHVECEVYPKYLAPNPEKGFTVGKYLTGYRWTHVQPDARIAEIDAARAAAKLEPVSFVAALGG